ncbi:MAG: aminotransferase class I/II-fold pyridoxal phosphate-dependent enzyme [Rhodothermales bacterium]|nr:aminotransferase class I/II-fold pyridoxal phosphate-dependent enzyme [Rhodothermales bacterium]
MRHKRGRHSFETRAVHAGRSEFMGMGVHAPPIDLSTTYPIGDLEAAIDSIDRLAAGSSGATNPIYARLHNPTVGRLEEAVAELEMADTAVAFSSGMAAMTAVILALKARGDHIVAVRPLYGGSDHLLDSRMLGVDITWATPDTIVDAIRDETSLVILETPGNPTLALVDIERAVQQAGDVPVLVDSTFATPVLQQPLRNGAAIVLHSATKFLGGHGDVIGGIVATSEELAVPIRQVRVATGAVLHPLGAYLLHRGMPTLSLRVERAQANAQVLASRLVEHKLVTNVMYPGLPGRDPLGVIPRQMSGPGSLISFELDADLDDIAFLMKSLEIITPAVSLGSTDTLIQHPAGLTHRVMSPEARKKTGITQNLVRLSVGVEDPDDLWNDLSHGFDAVSRRRSSLSARMHELTRTRLLESRNH